MCSSCLATNYLGAIPKNTISLPTFFTAWGDDEIIN